MTINAERLTKDFIDITAIDRESFNEREMVDEIIWRLESIGFEVTEDDAADKIGSNAGNLYGFLKGDLPGDPILFSCHLDTVSPGNGKKAIVDGDIIRSDGTTVLGGDDLTGILPIIHGVEAAIASGEPRRDIEVLFSVAEEVFTKGAKAFDFGVVKAKDAYILDVNGDPGEAALSAPSIIQFNAKMIGRAAHAGFAPETGVNAIAAMSEAISLMKQGRPDEESTFNVGTISGGIATNIVSEECAIFCEARSFNHARCEEIIEENRQILQSVADKYGATLEFEPYVAVVAIDVKEDELVSQRFVKACEAVGIEPKFKRTFGVTDGNYYGQLGIPNIVLATGMESVHSTNEYCYISKMVKNAELVAALVKQED